MSSPNSLLIDCRKAYDSGIGTYIRSVVPRVLALLACPARVLVPRGKAHLHTYLDRVEARRVEVSSTPLGLGEQLELVRLSASNEVFWATSLAHPLYGRCPMVATVHDVAQLALPRSAAGSLITHLASRTLLSSMRRYARALFFISDFTRDEFETHVGAPRGASAVTPLGVEPKWHAPVLGGVKESKPYFICVGNLRPHKNLRALLAAYRYVMTRVDHDLVVVGQHEGFRTADLSMPELLSSMAPRVRFLGHVDDDTLVQSVCHADALVLPSLYEGFGLPALEAMAAGVPVVASSAAALPEVCGDVASYFDPRSVESIAQALIAQAQLDPARRSAIREAGLRRAAQFTWERTANGTASALAAVFAGMSRRA